MKNFIKKIISSVAILALVVGVSYIPVHPVYGAAALVQTKSQNGGGYVNSYTVTMTSNTTTGNTLLACITAGSADVPDTITDSRSNTWTLIQDKTEERKTWMYMAYNISGGSTVINIGWADGVFADSITQVREYSGLVTTNPLDVYTSSNTAGGYVQSHSSGATAATTQAGELVIGCVGSGGDQGVTVGYTAGSGYSNGLEQKGFDRYTWQAIEDKLITSTGAQTATFTSTEFLRSQTLVATFKESGGGGVTPSPYVEDLIFFD